MVMTDKGPVCDSCQPDVAPAALASPSPGTKTSATSTSTSTSFSISVGGFDIPIAGTNPTPNSNFSALLKLVSTTAWVGYALAAVPFFQSYREVHSFSINDMVVQPDVKDYVALGFGPLACLVSIVAVVLALKEADRPGKRALLAAGAGVLGVFQTLRGFGVFG
jgi:hypothetical protein